MKISGSYLMPFPQERTYSLLQDPEMLAQCMPGCEQLVKIADDIYQMKLKMALAAISGQFDGKISIADRIPPASFRLIVEGTGKIGFMKGNGLLNLSPRDNGTDVIYDGDVQVGGTMAAVGQRLIDTTARMMIKRFFDKLCEIAKG